MRIYSTTSIASSLAVDLWGVQIEAGSVATAFQTATGTFQGELAACQRYYVRFTSSGSYTIYGTGTGNSSTNADVSVPLPTSMRITPATLEYASIAASDGSAGLFTPSSITLLDCSPLRGNIRLVCTGLTQFRPYFAMNNNNSAGYIGFSAEL